MAQGYSYRVGDIDLTKKVAVRKVIDPRTLRLFLGGRGFNAQEIYNEVQASTNPLDPENVLVFAAGPLVGTRIPCNGRFNVSSRSPLTNLMGDSNSAGLWAPALRKAGLDALIIRGKSDTPVTLFVHEGGFEIADAGFLWGRTVGETDTDLRNRYGRDAHVVAIGPAGENLVRFASIQCDIHRAAGRTGNGAVMGSKNLKAIVAKGARRLNVSDPEKVAHTAKLIENMLLSSPSFKARSQLGTPLLVLLYNRMGVLPAYNHKTGIFSGAERISGETLREKYVVKSKSCYACPIHCSRICRINEGRFAGIETEGPEFETLCAMGSNLGNDDLEAIIYLNYRLNELGLDSISTGGVIAFAMECFEKGLLTNANTENIDLSWGNTQAITEMVELIAFRRGIGNLLAEGVRYAAKEIKGSQDFALEIKGMEVPTQEVRGLKGWALSWAVASRGGDHCRAFPVMETTWTPEQAKAFFGSEKAADRFAYEGKAEMVKWAEDYGAVVDALGICKIAYVAMNVPIELLSEALQAVSGVDLTPDELLKCGERITNIDRLINHRFGNTPGQDTLPSRFRKESLPEGPCKGEIVALQEMITDYYCARDWNPNTGLPTQAKLNELSLQSTPECLKGGREQLP